MVSKAKKQEAIESFVYKVMNEGLDYAFENYSRDICKADPKLMELSKKYTSAKKAFIIRTKVLVDEAVEEGIINEEAAEEFRSICR